MDGEDRACRCAWPDGALVYLPDAPPDDTADEEVTLFPESKFYHIDGAGKSAFTKEEADRTFKRIQQMQFMERLCDSDLLNSVPFVLPQVDDVEIEAAFCNEQVRAQQRCVFLRRKRSKRAKRARGKHIILRRKHTHTASATKTRPSAAKAGCSARGLSGGAPPNPPYGWQDRACARPHMCSAAHVAHAPLN